MHDSLLRPAAQIVLGETVAKVFSVSRCLSFAKERASWLTPAEIGTLRALHQLSDQDRYLVAHVLGREVVADVVGVAADQVEIERAPCVRCTKPHGKPTVKGHSAGVSLSHAGAFVAVAVGPGAVGIDVEVRPSLEAMRELAPLLHANVSWPSGSVASTESDGGREFLRMWTRVEAVLKARGVGLLDGLHGVDPTVDSPLLIDQVIDQDHHVALSVGGHS